MAYYGKPSVVPFNCDHMRGMVYYDFMCWCEFCGQTWHRQPEKGWKPLDIKRVKHGEEIYG